MTARTKRRRLNPPTTFETLPLQPLTKADKARWNGFCEIESEPALFNVMLRDFGVKGVKVQEIVSLEDEMLALLHKPVYGLIFLFRWKEDDPDKQESSCPEGIWFANQTSSYACASVALLNIINNVHEIELGEKLQHFKDFTLPLTPALRGYAIGNFEFVKRVHNSFARKMDVLNADLQLKTEATNRRSRTKKLRNQDYDDSEAGFHFIGFVPAKGKLWKFDGLERQPQNLGDCSGDKWLDLAKPEIISRMAEYEEGQIEFSILGLVKDPLIDLRAQLATNIKCVATIDEQLSALGISLPDLDGTAATINENSNGIGHDPFINIEREEVERADVPGDLRTKYKSATPDELAGYREELVGAQKNIRIMISEEEQSHRADEDYAAARRHDYGPAVHTWVRLLARKQVIEKLVEEVLAY
ncbi:ubiquitin carboxyl-terminal hydrolase [Histoplasma capsulatum var. duboisii H88]|uniref:ubiquitinyl hydrolase 1 n=2 Tax=Ajellomyces capsulatus TaxID=5037 RepID=F0UFV7_AJEC8|nr:ubiquitin carboxyl-terminal hydrolase [Histoplasma capsulatum H143]EGC45006.1 ubiquitin carboxyl-terminal hydrolase [Histoplasma capsulatum var. duboisii H88]QSS55781.1 ubiquitin carboxyl-terminal hydrolase [Histoplasma capsulatum var. duboisii H88]